MPLLRWFIFKRHLQVRVSISLKRLPVSYSQTISQTITLPGPDSLRLPKVKNICRSDRMSLRSLPDYIQLPINRKRLDDLTQAEYVVLYCIRDFRLLELLLLKNTLLLLQIGTILMLYRLTPNWSINSPPYPPDWCLLYLNWAILL